MFHYDTAGRKLIPIEFPAKVSFVEAGRQAPRCLLYEPLARSEKSRIGVVMIHSDQDYSTFPIAWELAGRGYHTLAGQVSSPEASLDQKMLDIKHAIELLKAINGVDKVVLMGHSGGATLMSAYQGAAEQGILTWQNREFLYPYTRNEELIPADGVMLLDSNFGNGAMTLLSVDPAVRTEGNGIELDPALDIFNPKNGFDPQHPTYSDTFLQAFFAAQRERNNAIVHHALDRLTLLRQGKGNYVDDEPFLVTGASQMMMANKLIPQDVRLLAHTKKAYPLLHRDGSITNEIIHSLRRPRGGRPVTPEFRTSVMTTVRSYLSNRAVLARTDYQIGADGITGILWNKTYNCTPENVKWFSAPLLIMGMTGSYEYLAAEIIGENAASTDKIVLFVEGAGHNFDAAGRESEFGDTQALVYDTCDRWLSYSGRFL